MIEARTPFPLGTVVATVSAVAEIPLLAIHAALDRHAAGDWGNLPDEDRLANERALAEGERLLSAYETVGGATFWIITERIAPSPPCSCRRTTERASRSAPFRAWLLARTHARGSEAAGRGGTRSKEGNYLGDGPSSYPKD